MWRKQPSQLQRPREATHGCSVFSQADGAHERRSERQHMIVKTGVGFRSNAHGNAVANELERDNATKEL